MPRRFLITVFLASTCAIAGEATQKLLTTLSHRTDGAEVLELEVGSDDPERRFVTPEERAVLEKNRKEVVRAELEKLKTKCDLGAAMVLGELGEKSALPQLERCFLDDTYTYGWETDEPNPLDAMQHPHHYAFEEGISAVTGKKLEEVISLDDKATQKLLARKDDAARYVLYRLNPKALTAKVAAEFKRAAPGSSHRFTLALQLSYLVSRLPRAEMTNLLGPADVEEAARFLYRVQNVHEEQVNFVIEFDEAGLVRRAAVERPE
ncbi:MAG: hypothetical protein ACJ790_21450 [Myxococcaceae bacterium]